MSDFSDLMSGTAVPLIKSFFGDAATYTVDSTDEELTVVAIVDKDVVNPLTESTSAIEKQTIITIATTDLAGNIPRRNDVITIGADRYIVLKRESDDGYFSRIIVRAGDD